MVKLKSLVEMKNLNCSYACLPSFKIPYISPPTARILSCGSEESLLSLLKNIKGIEKQIIEIIKSNEALNNQYKLATSVPGIGWVTFCYLAFFTNQFTKYNNGKQLASYAGVVPFEYTSGTSVRGKARVHPTVNKELKRLLHTVALSARTHSQEFKLYFERKVAEGKNKMLVINNIRNKLILRVAAVIKNNKHYTPQMAA
ncbi:MAG: IS110 family transposase [Bacteroidetes bacterium]|nr:IS110 family transposase [Bacteroidota bacterium]MCA6443911.1 IS110 family transposase [Bacteroidota bacterium]